MNFIEIAYLLYVMVEKKIETNCLSVVYTES
jgi:hypothetical protein